MPFAVEAAAAEGRAYEPRETVEDAVPRPADQVNFTDPESRIMKDSDGAFVQAFNAQAAVDASSHIVLAAGVSSVAPDAEHFPGLVNETIATTGRVPELFSADAGYHSSKNIEHASAVGSDALIPPDKLRRSEWHAQQAPAGAIPDDLPVKDRMRLRLATQEGKRAYLQRQASVEPVFGATKGARGLRQFLHRGLHKNHHLFRFDMAVHNVLKILRHAPCRLAQPPSTPSAPQRSEPAATLITATAA